MKLLKAKFWFRKWSFEFTPLKRTVPEFSDRVYTLWSIEVYVDDVMIRTHNVLAFVPSACICKRLIQRHYKKPVSKKRKAKLIKNFK